MVKPLPPLLMLSLAACSAATGGDRQANSTDPAIAEAVNGPLMSDPQMGEAAAPSALRPGDQPASMPVPLDAGIDTTGAPTLGTVLKAALATPAFAGCRADIRYSAMWSVKLPNMLALPAPARLAEAAGSDGGDCPVRIVRFALPGAPDKALGEYETLAKREGFAVERSGEAVLATRPRDGVAFRVTATASADGTRVDLVTRTR